MVLGIGRSNYPLFPLLFITAAVCYTICILPTEVDNIVWLSVTSSIILILFVDIVSILFVRDIVQPKRYQTYTGLGMLFGVIDVAFSLIHTLALIMYSIIVARAPTYVDFSAIPAGKTGYALFWDHCLSNTVGYFFSAGVVNSTGVSGWGVLHNMLTIVTGSFVTLFALAVAVSRLIVAVRVRNKQRI